MASTALSFERSASIERLGNGPFDLAVIGGGVTGAGVALDAASRGLSTALVDKGDLASGTSSKSSKLVHGGLRYLEQKEFHLVYESLHERQRLLKSAPHLVEVQPFLIPLLGRGGVADRAVRAQLATALWLYDLTGGLRIGKRHRRLSKLEAASHMPTLKTELLAAGFLYFDARVDDARLTLSLARTAALDHGAVVCTYARAAGFEHTRDGAITGVTVQGPGIPDGTVVRARCVVNATGVWADEVRLLDSARAANGTSTIRPAKGVHLAVPHAKLPCDLAAVIPVRKDRRSIFVIPWAWGGQTYIGTTDTDYDGPLDDPQCTPEDVAYLLDAVNALVTEPLTPADVIGTWAGLRPLVASGPLARSARTADLSRRHSITTSPSGLVTVTGGKLTTYRRMASDTVDEVVRRLGGRALRCRTKRMLIRGASGFAETRVALGSRTSALTSEQLEHLLRRYGSEAGVLVGLCEDDVSLAEPLVPGLPYLKAEAVHAVRAEMATNLEDLLARRTRALILEQRATMDVAGEVASLIAPLLGWDSEERAKQVESFVTAVERSASAAGLALGVSR